MLHLDIDKIIVLENQEEYLILDKVLHEEKDYYYVAKVNSSETDIENNFKLVTVEENNGNKIVVEVTGENRLREILPLFNKEL